MATPEGKPNVSAQLVKELRDRTGAGFAACKDALAEAGGDIEQAINVLRKKGQAAAAKKAQRSTSEGLVSSYIHAGGKIGVLIEVNCESDFVARTDDFQRLCHDVAMHIAALDPRFLKRDEVTQETLDREREIYKDQAKQTGKPDAVVEKIVTGKMEKFYEENCLYEQHFIKDEGRDDQRIDRPGHRQDRREHHREPLQAVQGRRAGKRQRQCRRYSGRGVVGLN